MVRGLFAAGLLLAVGLRAETSLRVDRTQVRAGGSIEVTLELEGELARIHDVELPSNNLLLSEPSTSTEFSWRNGRTSRQRIYRWAATSRNVGPASVGPLTLTRNGITRSFPRIEIEVLPAPSAPANESQALDVLDDERKIVLVAEVDSSNALRGQQRVVSWWLYTRNAIRSVRVTSRPAFTDFWVEEIPLDQEAEPEVAADGRTTRYLARRTAIYPLRSGRLEIPPLGVTANLFERIESENDPFGVNRRIVEAVATSQPVALDVRPSPAVLTGAIELDCSLPQISAAGPVTVTVIAKGDANLRAGSRPAFESPINAGVEWLDEGTKSSSGGERVIMERTWRLTLFPRSAGLLEIPGLTLETADSSGQVEVLRCLATTVDVKNVAAPDRPGDDMRTGGDVPDPRWIVPAVAALAALSAAIWWFVSRRRRERRVENVRRQIARTDPSEMRQSLVAFLASQPSSVTEDEEVREAVRTFESVLDLRIREPWREDLGSLAREELAALARAVVRARGARPRSRS